METMILTTHWSDDYWDRNGIAPYTKYLDDLPKYISNRQFRALGIYKAGVLRGEHVDRSNLFPSFLKVNGVRGDEDRVEISYVFHGEKLKIASRSVLEEIQKLPRFQKSLFLPLCFVLSNEEWDKVVAGLRIPADAMPAWWTEIIEVEPQVVKPAEPQRFTVETFREKFGVGAYRTKYGFMVRSRMEVIISDFLMGNGIVVQYEPLLILDNQELYPDFYIPSLDIYVEYWGSEEEDYLNKRKTKEKLYQKYGIIYVSLDENDAPNIYDCLKQRLSPYFPGKADWR